MASETPAGFPKDLLGRYDRISFLASGGMGVLFSAHDNTLDKVVVIKALPSQTLLGTEKVVRFQKEAKAAGRLAHPNIVTVLDFGVTRSGDPFLIMDCINGRSLQQIVQDEGKLDPALALRFFLQLADGLSHAHKNGIIHRDIKTSNIMIDESDEERLVALIVDFGVAHMRKAESDQKGFESTGGNIIGSPSYVSPEVVSGRGADARSDVYSMGCMMFETLTGQLPFSGESAFDVMNHHVNTQPPSIFDLLDESPDELTSELAQIIARCLEKTPEARYQNAEELKRDLRNCTRLLDEDVRATVLPTDLDSTRTFKSWSVISQQGRSKIPPGVLVGILVLAGILPVVWMFFSNPLLKSTIAGEQEKAAPNAAPLDNLVLTAESLKFVNPTSEDLLETVTAADIKKDRLKSKDGVLRLQWHKVTDEAMDAIVALPITSLDLTGAVLSHEALKKIGMMKHIEILSLDQIANLTDEDVKAICRATTIRNIKLVATPITDESLANIAKIKRVSFVALQDCKKITGRGVSELRALPTLESIALGRTNVPATSLKGFMHLKDINLEMTHVSVQDMKTVAAMPELTKLTLTRCKMSPEAFFALTDSESLISLHMADVDHLTKADVEQYTRLVKRKHNRYPIIKTKFPYWGNKEEEAEDKEEELLNSEQHE